MERANLSACLKSKEFKFGTADFNPPDSIHQDHLIDLSQLLVAASMACISNKVDMRHILDAGNSL